MQNSEESKCQNTQSLQRGISHRTGEQENNSFTTRHKTPTLSKKNTEALIVKKRHFSRYNPPKHFEFPSFKAQHKHQLQIRIDCVHQNHRLILVPVPVALHY